MSDADDADRPHLFNGPTDPHGYGQEVPAVTILPTCRAIGHVNHVHGGPGRPCPEYVPTRYELTQLREFWDAAATDLERWWEESGKVGSGELSEHEYACMRVLAIDDILGGPSSSSTPPVA
jgi:hypothetical protein